MHVPRYYLINKPQSPVKTLMIAYFGWISTNTQNNNIVSLRMIDWFEINLFNLKTVLYSIYVRLFESSFWITSSENTTRTLCVHIVSVSFNNGWLLLMFTGCVYASTLRSIIVLILIVTITRYTFILHNWKIHKSINNQWRIPFSAQL